MTENTAMPNEVPHEYDATHGEADETQPAEAPQPGAPTDEEIAEDSNLWAKAEADDDAAVNEDGNDPDES